MSVDIDIDKVEQSVHELQSKDPEKSCQLRFTEYINKTKI